MKKLLLTILAFSILSIFSTSFVNAQNSQSDYPTLNKYCKYTDITTSYHSNYITCGKMKSSETSLIKQMNKHLSNNPSLETVNKQITKIERLLAKTKSFAIKFRYEFMINTLKNYASTLDIGNEDLTNTNSNPLRDLAITKGTFVAINNKEAMINLTVKNIGTETLSLDGISHTPVIDNERIGRAGASFYSTIVLPMNINAGAQKKVSIKVTLKTLSFNSGSFVELSIATAPNGDDNMANNFMDHVSITGKYTTRAK